MSKFYIVKDIGGGFDGLIVEGDVFEDYPPYVQVNRIIDRNSIVGDRNVSLPIPAQALLLKSTNLEETDDPGTREFASNNPFGKLILEGHMDCGNIKVAYSQFESVMSVTVTDATVQKTIFSQYFSKDFDKVKSTIEAVLKQNGDSDAEDLVFQLRALKEAESNG